MGAISHAVIAGLSLAIAIAAFRWLRGPVRTWLAFVVPALVLGPAWFSLSSATKAARTAEVTAAGRAFCIQIADDDDIYRPAIRLPDLSLLSMRSGGSQFHGVLVVREGPRWRSYNWSRRAGDWRPISEGLASQTVIRCVPRGDYAARMGWFEGVDQPASAFVRMSGRSLLIPREFKPMTFNGDYISILASPPGSKSGVPAAMARNEYYWRANVHYGSRSWFDRLVRDGRQAEIDLASADLSSPSISRAYVERDETGSALTIIKCSAAQSASNPAPCQHWFYRDGATWSFRQSADDLPEWRSRQRSLEALIGEWRAAGARCEAGEC